jgi:ATP-binding cassette subfamily C protein CydCD
MFSYANRYRRQLAAGLALGLLASGMELGQVVALKHAVDSATGRGPKEAALPWAALFAACVLLAISADALHNWRMSVTSQRLALDLQSDVHRKLHAIGEDLIAKLSPGEFAHLTLQDTGVAQQSVGLIIGAMVRHPATLLGLTGYLIYLDWRTASLALLGYGVLLLSVRFLMRGLQEQARRLQAARALIHQRFLNLLNGREALRCFDSDGRLVESLPQANDDFHRQASRYLARKFTGAALGRAIAAGFVVALVCYAGWRLRRGELSAGVAAAIAGSLVAFYQPATRLSGLSTDLLESLASAHRVFEVLDAPERWRPGMEERSGAPVSCVEFVNVERGFADRDFRLRGVNLRIEAGQIVLITGPSGGGKTTLIKTLTTSLIPQAGTVLLNRAPAGEVAQPWLQGQLAYLPQDCPTIGRTIIEEIQLGRGEASVRELEHAARCAEILDWIDSLPRRWDTFIGPGGMLISGGQRQRLALARVFLADRSLYVLDEPTAQLDRPTESRLIDRLCEHIRGRGGIGVIVSHRPSLIGHVDRLLRVQDGGCVEVDLQGRPGEDAVDGRVAP